MSLPTMPTHSYTHAMPPPLGRAETIYYHPILNDIYEVDNEDTAVLVMVPSPDRSDAMTINTISTFTSYNSGVTASAGTNSSQTLPRSQAPPFARHGLDLQVMPTGGRESRQLQRAMDDMAVTSGCGLAGGSRGALRRLLGLGLRRAKTVQ